MKLIAAAVAFACLLAAQDAPRPKNTYHSSGGASAVPRLVSPEVRLDRTIVSGHGHEREGIRVEGMFAVRVNIPGQPDGEPDDMKDDEPHPAGLRCYRIADAIRYRAPGQRLFLQSQIALTLRAVAEGVSIFPC